MMFSKACEYSIRASIYIASQSLEGRRTNLKEIAKSIDSPEAFTAKLLQQLVKNDIIDSVKGVQGGFGMTVDKVTKVKLCHIVHANDGDAIFHMCGIGLKACSEQKPCPIHNEYKSIRKELIGMLEKTSIENLSKGIADGRTSLKI